MLLCSVNGNTALNSICTFHMIENCKPGKVTRLRGSTTHSEITLKWEKPTTGGKASSYIVRYVYHTKPYRTFATKPEITLSIPCQQTSVFIGVSALSWCDVKRPPEFIHLTTSKFLCRINPQLCLNTSCENFDVRVLTQRF